MSCDPLHTQGGPVTRARAKKMREALNGLIEQIWVENNIQQDDYQGMIWVENNIQQANRSLDDYQGMVNIIQVSIMSSGDDKSTTKGHHVDESFMLKAMQQQFQRLDIMFGEIKDKMEKQDAAIAKLYQTQNGSPNLRRNDANDDFDDNYKDAFNNDAQNSNFSMGRFMRDRGGQRYRFNKGDQNLARWGDWQDHDLGSIKMKIPPFQGKNDLDVYLEGHVALQCPNKHTMILREDGEIETEDESDDDSMPPLEDADDGLEYAVDGELLVTRRALNVQAKEDDEVQRDNIFHMRCHVKNKIWVENNIQQANRSLDDYQGMVNIIQVQEKVS
ncbi:hypothetical protein SLEP1_g22876 [Rubroshorea leprosula]|uniref:Uncharacterized protein n=1 Tax=Rubroshorea leprosula TaxID=152421 RepID=A0AAV5JKY5_9ROSI|nr:hypothetical protein SLEP1_g22876 [Rubroshorea leprosula]